MLQKIRNWIVETGLRIVVPIDTSLSATLQGCEQKLTYELVSLRKMLSAHLGQLILELRPRARGPIYVAFEPNADDVMKHPVLLHKFPHAHAEEGEITFTTFSSCSAGWTVKVDPRRARIISVRVNNDAVLLPADTRNPPGVAAFTCNRPILAGEQLTVILAVQH